MGKSTASTLRKVDAKPGKSPWILYAVLIQCYINSLTQDTDYVLLSARQRNIVLCGHRLIKTAGHAGQEPHCDHGERWFTFRRFWFGLGCSSVVLVVKHCSHLNSAAESLVSPVTGIKHKQLTFLQTTDTSTSLRVTGLHTGPHWRFYRTCHITGNR